MIYYICPSIDIPIGGIKVIYKHVDILNQLGYQAYVYHELQGFRCDWFENNTRIIYQVVVSDEDIMVFPEIMLNKMFKYKCRKIIFNQNVYYENNSDQTLSKNVFPNAYHLKDLEKVMVVSEDNYRYLKMKYTNLNICIIRNSIDKNIFKLSKNKKRQIAYMSRKNNEHIKQIMKEFYIEDSLKNWVFIDINCVREIEVAKILSESSIFLSTGGLEGFGLPAAEAIISGCVVIGYDGGGGKEFFECCAKKIEFGDIKTFIKVIKDTIDNIEKNFSYYDKFCEKNSKYIAERYSSYNQLNDIKQTFAEMFSI